MGILTENLPSPSYITESSKYASLCFSALLLTASNVATINFPSTDMLPSASYDCYHKQNKATGYNFDGLKDFIENSNNAKLSVNYDYDQENEIVFSEFFNKLTSNMKTLPFEIFEDIAERPWDFV